MKNKIVSLLVGAVAMAAVAVQAMEINGSIAFEGTPTLVGGGTFLTATGLTFGGVSVNSGEALGSYLPADG